MRRKSTKEVIVFEVGVEFWGIWGFIPAPSRPWIGVVDVEEGVGTVVFVTSAVLHIINCKI